MGIEQSKPTNQISCQIFGLVGVVVQIVLGVLSFSILIIKRYQQNPKRSWKIWAMDTSKQGSSQLIAHFINIGISLLLSAHLSSNACTWYFITNLLDNSIGVFFCCSALRLIEGGIFTGKWQKFCSGNYYDIVSHKNEKTTIYMNKFSVQTSTLDQQMKCQTEQKKQIMIISYFAWVVQFLVWNIIVSVCKACLLIIQFLLNKPLNWFSSIILGWLSVYPTLELIIVIIIIPTCMNGLAFWIQDNFLKKQRNNEADQNYYKSPLM